MSKKGLLPCLPATGGCCCSIGAAAICRPRSPPPSPLMRAIKPRSRKKSVGGFANGQGLSAPANGLTGKPLWSLSCPLCSCTSCSFSFPVHNLQTQLECSQSKRKDIQFEIRCTGVGQNVQTFLFACNCCPPCYQAPNNKVVTISWLPNGLPLDKFKRQYLYF